MTNPLFDLSGKTALVTGSSRGLGRAMAEGLAVAGARILINGTDPLRVAETVSQFQAAGHAAEPAAFDVTDEAQIVRPSTPSTLRASRSTSSSTMPASSSASRWSSSPPPTGSA